MPLSRRSFLQLGVTAATGLASRGVSSSPIVENDEPWRMSVGDLARAIREKKLSSREVITSHLERIEAVNGKLNAITDVMADQALAAADEADRALARSSDVGKLHGVPMTVKENIDLRIADDSGRPCSRPGNPADRCVPHRTVETRRRHRDRTNQPAGFRTALAHRQRAPRSDVESVGSCPNPRRIERR